MMRRIRFAVWLIYFGAMFFVTHLPQDRVPLARLRHSDLVLHFLGFAGAGILTVWMAAGGRHRPRPSKTALWFGAIALYAAIDELTQPLAGRACELSDWIADSAGGLAGLWIGMRCFHRRLVT